MEVENSGTGVSRLHMEAENQRIDGIEAASGVSTVDECEQVHKMDCSEVIGPPAMVAGDSEVNGQEAPLAAEAETKAEVKVKGRGGGQKRKRGRPQRGQAKPPPSKKKREEEDVCFICFDGGNLVLCDRRGCPKAYHPACIKRDEAFFRSRARWNCGWHICNRCQKAAHYMCYTCTYSLCKGCTKDADYQCVRGSKGFCTTCMRTIMLIENNEQGNNETAQVDFDDKSSWEYLFKVYWIYLKEKLSLTLRELTQAKNPWSGAGVVACKGRPLDLNIGANDGRWAISDSSSGHLDTIGSKRRKTKEHPEFLNRDYLSGGDRGTKLIVCTEWASKELLDFVAYMNNGDRSVLPLLDVQALLHDYIKRNNLLDPQQKSKIICDFRLKTLFGKPCIDHSEMLKLLESHFHIKEDSKREAIWPTVQGGVVDAVAREVAADSYNDNLLMMGKDQSYKTSTKGEDKGLQMNVDDYAAIDVHNVNLIYMRRNLVEGLIEDNEKFHDKVIGSIVRARISSSDQKQYIYRLVQVVGTSKASVAYKLGERTTDIMLEILNLDKKEAISIDAISDQEFSKDECRCLRQNINHGLVKRLTVGDIQKKAMALQRVKLDCLERERWQLKHLCDQASKEGHNEQHRECVVKLQHLKTTEERQRLDEIPEVHADLNMDPNYRSEEDGGESDMKQDQYVRPKCSEISRNGREASSPQKGGDISNDAGGRAWKNSTTCGQSANICSAFYFDKKICTRSEIKDSYGLDSAEKLGNQVDSADSVTDDGNNQSVGSGSCYGVASESSTVPPPTGMTASLNDTEVDKLWHYRDLNGKIQGPFSMMQLRKWSTTGYFQPDQRIWGINDEENPSLLLTDALEGHFQKPSCFPKNLSLRSPEVGVASDRKLFGFDCGGVGSMESTGVDSKQNDGRLNCNEVKPRSSSSNEFVRSNASGSHSSDWSTHVNYKDGQAGSPSQCWDSFKGDNSYQDDERSISDPSRGNWISHKTSVVQISTKQSHENQSNSQGHSGQTSGQNWKSLPANFSSSNWDSSSGFASKAKLTDSSEQNHETDFPNLPYHTPKTTNGDWEGQVAENKQSVSLNAQDQDSHTADLPSHTPMSGNGDEKGQATENKQSLSSNFIVQDPSSASSLVVGSGVRLHEIADEWGGYSSTPAKPSAEEFESGLMSASSLKPPEAVGDHAATPTSNIDQFTHSSPSHPPSNAASVWQDIFSEPIELSTLAEESVSDLLAEVDAMESRCGLASPTSKMNSGENLIEGSKNDCFSSIEGLSPTLDTGKSDALSSTSDIQLPSQSTVTDESLGTSQGDVLDPVKRSGEQSSTSAHMNRETRLSDVPYKHYKAGPSIQAPAPSPVIQNIMSSDSAWQADSEAVDTGWGTMKGLRWGGSDQGITNLGWEDANISWPGSAGSIERESHPRYSGERFAGPREGACQSTNLDISRVRSSWSWQSSSGGGRGGGYSRPSPKGQRLCKFYASGHCKKGALCDYLHR